MNDHQSNGNIIETPVSSIALLNLKKKRKYRKNVSKIYGALDRELLEKQSTKVTT